MNLPTGSVGLWGELCQQFVNPGGVPGSRPRAASRHGWPDATPSRTARADGPRVVGTMQAARTLPTQNLKKAKYLIA
jgi:hypothetical protein